MEGSYLCVRGPGTEVCFKAACLEGDTMDVSCLDFPVAFAGAGNHINNLGEGAGEEGFLHVVSDIR